MKPVGTCRICRTPMAILEHAQTAHPLCAYDEIEARPRPPATHRATPPLWWFHRNLDEDDHADAIAAIVDVEIERAGQAAAAYSIAAGDDPPATARAVALAEQATRRDLAIEATKAIEGYRRAREDDRQRQRRDHVRNHGCNEACPLLRSRL